MTLRVGLVGATGRMGAALRQAIAADATLSLSSAYSRDADLDGVIGACDVLIDFSAPALTAIVAERAAAQGRPMVVGTTGLDDAAHASIARLERVAPVVVAPNTSIGVAVLAHLVREATRLLGPSFDAEIVELHHKHKVDAPSGTALVLARDLVAAREGAVLRHGREGRVGPRRSEEIGMHAVRAGDIVGEHTVYFAGEAERIELTHRAHRRELFAQGALRAARWVVDKPAGRFGMDDVLGIAARAR